MFSSEAIADKYTIISFISRNSSGYVASVSFKSG
jgi:hypothetical protein